jgi:hypothetical protein
VYHAELDRRVPIHDLESTEGFGDIYYAADQSAWVTYTPEWATLSFAFLLDGREIVCAGAEDVDKATEQIDDCLQTLFAAGTVENRISRDAEVKQYSPETDPPDVANTEPTDEGLSVSIDYEARRAKRIDAALTNQRVDPNEVYDPTVDQSVPVVYQDEKVLINGGKFDYTRSESNVCAVAYRFGDGLLFNETEITEWLSVSNIRAAGISDTGVALLGGNLSEPSSDASRGAESDNKTADISIEVGSYPFDANSDDIALYTLGREELYRTTTEGLVRDCDITGDGSYACVLTERDGTTHLTIYESPEWSQILTHETEDRHPSTLRPQKEAVDIRYEDGQCRCYLSETPADDPTYAIDLSGKVVWETDKRVLRDDADGLMTKLESPAESVPTLENTYASAGEALRALQTIARRHPTALEEVTERLINLLETDPTELQDSKTESANSTASMLFTDLGGNPRLVEPHIEVLRELVLEGTPSQAELAASCLAAATKTSTDVLDRLLQQFSDVCNNGSIPIDVIEVLEPGLGTFLSENPQRAEALRETIEQTEDIEDQGRLFGTLSGAIRPQLPEAVRAPLATPVAECYVELVDAFQEASGDTPAWRSERYDNILHGNVADVLEAVLEPKPDLIEGLIEPLLDQHIIVKRHSKRQSAPGDPLDLLQVCIVIDVERTRAALNEHRSKTETVISEVDWGVTVDLLLCLGDSWAREQLDTLRGDVTEITHSRRHLRTPERAFLAEELLERETTVAAAVKDPTLGDTETQLFHSEIDLVTYRVVEQWTHECYEHLREVESAMRSDFEAQVDVADDPLLSDFEEWWKPVRERLKRLPDVELRGHTYYYTS